MGILDDVKLQLRSGDVIIRLIAVNAVLYAMPNIVFGIAQLFGTTVDWTQYISLSSDPSQLLWKPWSLLSYSFFHAGLLHVLFNLLMLNFAGRLFMTFFTQKQLLGLYLTGALFAGVLYIASYAIFPKLINENAALVGASASVMAILFATVAYSPMMPLRLLIFGNVKLWHIAMVLIVIDLIQLPRENTGGHIAHLGGALFGYIYTLQLKSGRDIASWAANWVESLSGLFVKKQKKSPLRKVHRNYAPKVEKPVSRIVTKDKVQQQIDEILDKISKSGYESLTKDEKEFLFRAGKNE